ncbi:MAG: B12-binding domain-containing radical SAM protein [Gemmatimonadetes bacterium]|uniref:B12-binding domain-containing radical SAM protein n=1 Tax=Candidatus Kutchimonas denitrificans TaxID=3056748 RepID=A0AAE4Z496_9BACT|nr:B12-binding domain-containing radical SAM protein [Gemmatimonadota bacterium]NIR73490.1 B12-binding domain-containing radical SAM protein [Candidatus Kutchimonas denitrificans]NIS00894.1 B12-binding domain-containing radical SAM protein [Gemmatimonadota bacterium]NIT65063.1 B12-binding domain-containing radical SAM protein [Gemmatimonadota bacterium]NIV23053.1 radical SAM protein [Gemmatimonadota bacterium]
MDKIKFLLINPTSPLWRACERGRPRGPRVFRFSMLPSLSIAAAMPPEVETRILDEDVEPIDIDADADLIGISCMTFNAPRAYEVADRFRFEKGKPVILGGFHPTFLPEEAIQHADAVCVGEAEPNVPRLIEDFKAGCLRRFYRERLTDLKGLPRPDRSLIRRRAYITPDVLQATRGCPYRCKFCSIAAFHDYRIRTRPVEEVIDELASLGRHIIFMDDNLIADRDYAMQLFAAMIPLNKIWFSQCAVGIASDEELLRLAVRSGCRGLFIGFESITQESLRGWRKGRNRARDYRKQVRRLHEAGIGVYAGFVFGADSDGPEIFEATLTFLLDSGVDALQATRLTPFPGTPLYDELDAQGRIFDKDWGHYDFAHVVFEPLHMSRETLHRGTAWVLREFYARRRIARRWWNQMGYLGWAAFTRVSVPLNLGYRTRLTANGTMDLGSRFAAPRACA